LAGQIEGYGEICGEGAGKLGQSFPGIFELLNGRFPVSFLQITQGHSFISPLLLGIEIGLPFGADSRWGMVDYQLQFGPGIVNVSLSGGDIASFQVRFDCP
jgi:hypothetical protein